MVTARKDVAEVLFGKTRRSVLGLLFSRPTERFHLRQVERLTGTGIGALQRELGALAQASIVTRETEGVHVLYRANPDSPVFEEMKALVLKTTGIAAVLRETLRPLEREIFAAYLFGSVSRGQQHADSDVDVLLISDSLSLARVVTTLSPAEAIIGREINPVVYRLDEIRKKLRDKHPFLTRVMTQRKLLLVGDEHVLG
jgi:uncharacterized protein